MKTLNDKQVTDKRAYIIGYAHVKNFIDCNLTHLGLTDSEIANVTFRFSGLLLFSLIF